MRDERDVDCPRGRVRFDEFELRKTASQDRSERREMALDICVREDASVRLVRLESWATGLLRVDEFAVAELPARHVRCVHRVTESSRGPTCSWLMLAGSEHVHNAL